MLPSILYFNLFLTVPENKQTKQILSIQLPQKHI